MTAYEIIRKKRNGLELTREELAFFINGYTNGAIPDYQMTAFLMASYFRGMTDAETAVITETMLYSGKTIDLSRIGKICVDKHSTGGVGDKVSIALAPLVAAGEVPVPMISGRGLGHTGGTLDKLESIPGFRTNLTIKEFIQALKEINVAMMGQTAEIVPADKKMYALRDVTATVECIPLIAGSIMSKKLAEGAHGLVFDVKTGSGAFMQKYDDSVKLAKTLVGIAKKLNRTAVALITDMNQPLGNAVGNAVEVQECIDLLKGQGPADLVEITVALGGYMLYLGKVVLNPEAGKKKIIELIQSGKGLEKFIEMVEEQGGDPSIVENPNRLPQAKKRKDILAPKSGFVQKVDAYSIGTASVNLGAGRKELGATIDPAVGIIIKKKIGDAVKKNEPVATVLYNRINQLADAEELIKTAYVIDQQKSKAPKLILKTIK
ncbi:MAG: thymidine phosphorylase [bacterium]|nr:thymidine phosphorylase [bacterium]